MDSWLGTPEGCYEAWYRRVFVVDRLSLVLRSTSVETQFRFGVNLKAQRCGVRFG